MHEFEYLEELGLERVALDESGRVLEDEVCERHRVRVASDRVQMLCEPVRAPEPRSRVL